MNEKLDKPAETSISISFEPLTESGLDEILEIEKRCFTYPWTMAMFLSCIRHSPSDCSLVARKGGAAIGYAIFQVIIDEMHLLNIAVDLDCQMKGIGSRILKKVHKIAEERDVTAIYLEVRRSNEPAINMYKKFGYQIIDVRKKYYSEENEDALVMVWHRE
jgi:[ribosomal protein S18]-alanine N-acetyltransferase